LERVHDLVPSMRVIFAGRRPLALAGDGWQINEKVMSDPESPGDYRYLPERKSYLRLHVIRGFTKGEAEEFFATRRKLRLTPEQLDAIPPNSPDVGIPADIHWIASKPNPNVGIRPDAQAKASPPKPDVAIPPPVQRTASPPSQSDDVRYNPFDLSLYANWV